MTVKIEKVSDGRKTVIRLSGRLRLEHLDELKTQIDGDKPRIVLHLDSVTLVDVEVVRFLSACEERGIELIHGWPYNESDSSVKRSQKDKAAKMRAPSPWRVCSPSSSPMNARS
jgi:hypothetical protein